ncbi:carbohydrate ABC transporter permease [Pedococcus sp. 2YAF34]|uniref:carbohydrate ABC transporter permease n=1 Tax=Pedococcus sp. 2YAF34 TaxID=3233032 RepID=UPI003F98883E
MTGRPRWLKLLLYIALVLAGVFFVIPVLWTVVSSFKQENDIQSYPPQWLPSPFTLESYTTVLTQYPYLRWLLNSVVIAVVATLGILVCSTMAAYALARFRFRGRRVLYQLIIVMLLIPIQAYVIPLYLMSSRAHLLNTYPGLVLPLVANVTSIFILHAFFRDLPDELEQAARIDGAGEFRIFWQVMLPLSKPALSTVAILTFIANWNQFLWPLIAVRNDDMMPLPVAISRYWGAVNQNASFQYGTALAACSMAVIPTIVVYLALQRYFVEGIANSGIKG